MQANSVLNDVLRLTLRSICQIQFKQLFSGHNTDFSDNLKKVISTCHNQRSQPMAIITDNRNAFTSSLLDLFHD